MRMIHGATDCPIANHGALQRLLVGGLGPAPAMGRPWVDPPGGSTIKALAHAAFSSGCVPYLMRMIHGATDCPIANDGALQRLLVLNRPASAMPRHLPTPTFRAYTSTQLDRP